MTNEKRLESLFGCCMSVIQRGLTGSFVECGVYKGGSSMMMAYTLQHQKKETPLILFDTFAGMTEPEDRDVKISRGYTYHEKWKECQKDGYTDWCYGSLDEVKKNLKKTNYRNVSYVVGDVGKTIKSRVLIDLGFLDKISILRIDVDFYKPTKHVMEHLFPMVEKGGFVIFDDYYCWEGTRDAVNEYFREAGFNKREIAKIDQSCGIYRMGGLG